MQEPWLLELHQKLWKQESLRPVLFRTAKITPAHYSELQTRLNKEYPTRHSNTYKADDVLPTKLDILQNFVPEPFVVDDSNADDKGTLDVHGEGDPEVNDDVNTEHDDDDLNPDELLEFLPTRIRYVDITPLRLEFPPRVAFPVLLRDEYDVITTILDGSEKGIGGSCLITGQPGAGKTSYLYVLLIDRLLKGQDTIFQSKGTVYEISKTVRELPSYQSPTLAGNDVLALVDASSPQWAPGEEVCDSRQRMVIISPPKNEKSRGWMKQLPGGVLLPTYVINPFSLKEFLLTGIFLHPKDVTYARLNATRRLLGNNPRYGFPASSSTSRFKKQVALINEQITAVPASTNILSLIFDVRRGGEFSQRLFEMYSFDEHHFLANCPIRHVSDWSFKKLLEKYEEREVDVSRKLFNLIQREPPVASINEAIWERQCNLFFRSLRSPRSFILRALDDSSKSVTWDYPGDTFYRTFKSGSFPTLLQALIEGRTSSYLEPVSTTFPTLDSLVYQPGFLIFLKMTAGMEHDGSIVGFERIQRRLNPKGPVAHLHASESRPWKFVFVVPEEMAPSFKQQSFGKTWNSKVKQYVLGLSQKDVWEL